MFGHLICFYSGLTINVFRIFSLKIFGLALSGQFIVFVFQFEMVIMRIIVRGIASRLFISNVLEYHFYESKFRLTFISISSHINSSISSMPSISLNHQSLFYVISYYFSIILFLHPFF